MVGSELPEGDEDAARELRFYVAKKFGQGKQWITVKRDLLLPKAMVAARYTFAYEVGVFLESASGGFLYWSSLHPDLYSSNVLRAVNRCEE